MANTGHLNGLKAKMAARDKRHAAKGNKSCTGKRIRVPAICIPRLSADERREAHRARMAERRNRQLARRPGFTPTVPA